MLTLLRQRDFGHLWSSALISGIGNFSLVAALPYYVYAISGSTLASGATLVSETVPMVLFSSIGGVFADRWRRKPVLVASDWLRGLILLPLFVVHSTSLLWIVYITAFLGSAVANFAGPFGNAAVPHVVREEELPTANATFSAAGFVAVLVGSSLGAILLQRAGLGGVVIADAATFAISALLVSRIRTSFEERSGAVPADQTARANLSGPWKDWLLGVQYVLGERWISLVFTVMMLVFVGNSIVGVCLAPFVRHVLHGSAQAYASLLTAQGIGGVLATLVIGPVARRVPPARLLSWSVLLLGLLQITFAVAQNLEVTVGTFVLGGAIILLGVASMNTLIQAGVPDAFRGRVSGTFLTTTAISSFAGSLVASFLADAIGIRFMIGIGGVLFVSAGVTEEVRTDPLQLTDDVSGVARSGTPGRAAERSGAAVRCGAITPPHRGGSA